MGLVIPAVVVGTVLVASRRPKKRRRKKKALPTGGCELYPWLPERVDEVGWSLIEGGILELDALMLEVARRVYPMTPEGQPQPWPPAAADERARCLWDRIAIRLNLLLAQWAEQQAEEPELPDVEPPEMQPGVVEEPSLVTLPTPGPVDVSVWENPDNYPQPGTLHQVYPEGANNSGKTLKHIAQKAIAQAVMLLTEDPELAQAMSDDEAIWKPYRELVDCSPWNHAAYGVKHPPRLRYDTPTGDQICMRAMHDDVRRALREGRPPRRTVIAHDAHEGGGHYPYLWLPPVDGLALLEGQVRIPLAYWLSGDSRIMPPPEVLVLGLANVPPERLWGCLGHEASWPAPDGAASLERGEVGRRERERA